MFLETLRAFFTGFIPIAGFTYMIMHWSIASGRMRPFTEGKNLHKQYEEQVKKEKKRRKKEKKAKANTDTAGDNSWFSKKTGGNMLHNKVMEFGGGYYGMMAFFTYVLIEVGEIFDFLKVVFTPGEWFRHLGFQLILDFIINSIMNFVYAMIWFITLAKMFEIHNAFIWIALTYAGYYTGLRMTMVEGETYAERISNGIKALFNDLKNMVLKILHPTHKPDQGNGPHPK